MKTSARPRSGPVPNQPPIRSTPAPVVMNGMATNCAIGLIRNAVSGDAASLDALREPEHPPLALEGHHLLQDGLLRGLGERHETEPDEHAHREQHDPRAAA